jgi:hypothetical protein
LRNDCPRAAAGTLDPVHVISESDAEDPQTETKSGTRAERSVRSRSAVCRPPRTALRPCPATWPPPSVALGQLVGAQILAEDTAAAALHTAARRPNGVYELIDDSDPVPLPGWITHALRERPSTGLSAPPERASHMPGGWVDVITPWLHSWLQLLAAGGAWRQRRCGCDL